MTRRFVVWNTMGFNGWVTCHFPVGRGKPLRAAILGQGERMWHGKFGDVEFDVDESLAYGFVRLEKEGCDHAICINIYGQGEAALQAKTLRMGLRIILEELGREAKEGVQGDGGDRCGPSGARPSEDSVAGWPMGAGRYEDWVVRVL